METILMAIFALLLLASLYTQRDKRKNDEASECELQDDHSFLFWMSIIIILMTTV